jgi:GNAT superfamily N-acetyltransferase
VKQPDPVLAAALTCVDYFYARMFRDWPDAVTRTLGDCTVSFSGDTQLTGANHLWPNTPDALSPIALYEAAKFFAPFHAAWSAVFTDPYMPHAAHVLADYGYSLRWQSPLMVLTDRPQWCAVNPAARVVRATTEAELIKIAQVMSEAFATTNIVNQRVARPEHLNDPAITHYLLYNGDDPASCATVAAHNGMAGIWNVGTRRRFRRQGFATTLMIALLDDLWQRGIAASMLMASPGGEPIYRRLGYRHIGTTMYMRPPHFVPARFDRHDRDIS